MGTTWSSLLKSLWAIPVTIILAVIAQQFLWADVKPDGTPLEPLPPMPKGKHFLRGHLDQLGTFPQKKYTEWSKKLGDLFVVYFGTRLVYIINSVELVKELFEDQSRIFSTRVDVNLFESMMSGSLSLFIQPYAEPWRKLRLHIHHAINRQKIDSYYPVFESATDNVMRQLAREQQSEPLPVKKFTDYFAVSVLLPVVFGKSVEGMEDPFIKDVDNLMTESAKMNNSWMNVNSMNWAFLKGIHAFWNAGTNASSIIRHRSKVIMTFKKLFDDMVEKVSPDRYGRFVETDENGNEIETKPKKVKKYKGQFNVAAHFLSLTAENEQFPDEDIVVNLVALFEHGYILSSAALNNLIALLAEHPGIQEKAYEEVEAVLASYDDTSRVPSLEDYDKLPYIHSLVKETFRFKNPLPLGIPHAARATEIINGGRVTEGAEIYINTDAIHFNPKIYQDPNAFTPSRFSNRPAYALTSSYDLYGANLEGKKTDRDHYAFGAGRRICLGIHIVERIMVLFAARLVWTFKIEGNKGGHFADRLTERSTTEMADVKVKFVIRESAKNLF